MRNDSHAQKGETMDIPHGQLQEPQGLTRRGMLKSALIAAPVIAGCRPGKEKASVPTGKIQQDDGPPVGLIGPERKARFAYVDELIRTGSSEGEPSQLVYKSAGEQSRMLRAKKISCRELTDAHLAQIERINPTINALAERYPVEDLRKQADAVDRAIRRGEVNWQEKPLTGLFVWGKSLKTKGLKFTWASVGLKNKNTEPEKEDTIATALLRNAGAIVAGLTNTPEFANGYETDNLLYGRTNNPRHLDYTPGGSSGGLAAAMVAGFGPLGLGTDGTGSSRQPAANTGCVGLKETLRRCPGTGEAEGYGVTSHLVVHGPLARYVRDAAMMGATLAEADGIDPFVPPMAYPDYTRVKMRGLRIAVMPYNGIAKASPEILSALDSVAGSLEKAGAVVRKARPAMIEDTFELINSVWRYQRLGWDQMLKNAGMSWKTISPNLARYVGFYINYEETHGNAEPARVMEIDAKWGQYQKSIAKFFMDHDALLCPVQTEPAFRHGTTNDNMSAFSYTPIANLAGVPAISVPATYLPNGLTADVQVISRRWRDDIVLAVSEHIEKHSGGFQPSSLPLFQNQ